MDTKPYVVTISHLLGSGGAYLGEKLAARLGIPFFDPEKSSRCGRHSTWPVPDLENREERLSTFWDNYNRVAMLTIRA